MATEEHPIVLTREFLEEIVGLRKSVSEGLVRYHKDNELVLESGVGNEQSINLALLMLGLLTMHKDAERQAAERCSTCNNTDCDSNPSKFRGN